MDRRKFLACSSAAAALVAPLQTLAETPGSNPLLARWTGPYGGVPPFDKIKVEHFKPALEAAMAENLREVESIASNPAAPTFENTIAALEDSGRSLAGIGAVYGVWGSTLNTEGFQQLQMEIDPKLAALGDQISRHQKLFTRVDAVHRSPAATQLTAEQQRLSSVVWGGFVRSGSRLDDVGKARVAAINQDLNGLFAQFNRNLLADERSFTVLETEADLAGLSVSYRAGAAAWAKDKGREGKWVVVNTRSWVDPFLTESTRRDLREKVWRKFISRGGNGDANDNKALVLKILKLRAERAKLNGYQTHAHWRLENAMAKTPERALALMEAVWIPAVARVHQEVRDMQVIANQEGVGLTIEPWDYRFFQEKVRKARYRLEPDEAKPYLQLDKIREASFWVARQLYDLELTEVHDVPKVHADVRVWEVKRGSEHIGLIYNDPFARTAKRTGAWMNEYRSQEKFRGRTTPIVSNNWNFAKPRAGQPALLSWDEAVSVFFLFGHALQGLCSDVSYPTLAGTKVARDFVSVPAQLFERWLSQPEILGRFALHHQTGQPMPDSLVERIRKASVFNQGFATVEFLASALIDLKLHMTEDPPADISEFEREELRLLGMPKEVVMRHRPGHFNSAFGADGYSSAYYAYLWADILAADAASAFEEAPGGFFDRPTAKRLHDSILKVGNTTDPAESFRTFRGRDPDVRALLRHRGFGAG